MVENLSYRGFLGSVEYSVEDGHLFGKVINVSALVSYEGRTMEELEKDFVSAIEDYLALCDSAK